MTKPILLLSTCGTSVLTNGFEEQMRNWLNRITNLPILSAADASRFRDHLAQCKDRLSKADEAGRRKLSAELNGIGAVLER
jgi:hypothetical protein